MSATFRRVRAEEVLPGMRVAQARSHPFNLVTATERLPVSTRIFLTAKSAGGEVLTWTIRPRHERLLWVREQDACSVCGYRSGHAMYCTQRNV